MLQAQLAEVNARRERAEQSTAEARRDLEAEHQQKERWQVEIAERERAASEELQRQVNSSETSRREQAEEIRREQQARQEAEAALEEEKRVREHMERTIQGISPIVVPSLLEAFARVAQLTDKVL